MQESAFIEVRLINFIQIWIKQRIFFLKKKVLIQQHDEIFSNSGLFWSRDDDVYSLTTVRDLVPLISKSSLLLKEAMIFRSPWILGLNLNV